MDKRFYIEKENFITQKENIQIGDKIFLSGDENNHFFRVLRGKVGDSAEFFYDGSDFYLAKALDVGKNSSTFEITDISPCVSNPKLSATLYQGLPKLDKMELITQKLCEIGVSRIVPFLSKFTIAKENGGKIDRLNKISISVCKQCGRTKLLKVESPIKFDKMLETLSHFDMVIFANEKEKEKALKTLLQNNLNAKNIAIVVGSEGGFSDDEIQRLSKKASSITLGKRILRTETAPIFISSMVFGLLEN